MLFRILTPLVAATALVAVFASCVGDDPATPNVIVAPGDGGGGGDGTAGGCSGNERTCFGSELRGCKLDGTGFEVLGTCASDALCMAGLAGGRCVEPACAANEVTCADNDRVKCKADRTGTEKIETCPGVCVAGKCEECADGSADCVGLVPRKCVANKWQNQTACTGGVANACYAGTCTDTRIPRWEMPNEATALVRPAKYTVVSTNIVRDDVTKLEWQRGVSPAVDVSGGQRAKYCEALVLDGKQGFHVASTIELVSLFDHGKTGAKIDATAFTGTPTFLVGGENAATSPRVSYGLGAVESESIIGGSYPTRCVRATQPPPTGPRFTVGTDEVTDNFTKLVWKKADSGYITQSGALANCVAPFRLPTLKEIFTLFDLSQTAPYYDKTAFTRPDGDFYWSSTDKPGTTSKLTIDFSSNYGATATRFDGRVRCVR